MLTSNANSIKYNFLYCQQCGICEAICSSKAISLRLQQNGLQQIIIDEEKCIRCKKCVNVCPANKEASFDGYFDSFPQKEYLFAYNENKEIRHDSSSGGACKTFIVETLKSRWVDGVYSLKKTDNYPFAEGAFYTKDNLPDYDKLPNSVYHSVMLCRNVNQIEKCKRLMLVGTSCQLRAMEKVVKGKYEELIRVCIFCKQQKTLDSTRFLARVMGTSIPNDLKFNVRYRGKGWQGTVQVRNRQQPWNRAAAIPFGRRLWTVPGCDVCGDPFGTLCGADISLMDPWIIREANDLGETLITIHTEKGKDLIEHTPHLLTETKSYQQISPALALKDIWRKQLLVPYFLGKECNTRIKWAGKMEQIQRSYLRFLAEKILTKLPYTFSRITNRLLPDWRNIILK